MDKDELEQEISKIQDSLYARAYSKLKNKENVEDVITETLYLIVKNYKQLRNKNLFKAWAFKILDNECIKFYKQCEEDKKLLEKVKEYAENSEDSFVDYIENDNDFEEWLKVLDEDERKIFILHCKECRTFEKISEILNENPNTVRSKYRRGKEKLKGVVKNSFSKIALILLISIIFTSGIVIAGVIVRKKLRLKDEFEVYYNDEQVDNVEFDISDNKLKVKIDFNESKVNKDNFKVYPKINPIYLVNIGNDEKIFYSKTFAWIENDILEIEFDCNSDDLSSNASIRIVLIEGENITILLKK